MSENDTIFYQSWVNDLQMSLDSTREQREEDKKIISELQKQIALQKQTIERLQVAMSQGDDFR
jgi:hypothetical protein